MLGSGDALVAFKTTKADVTETILGEFLVACAIGSYNAHVTMNAKAICPNQHAPVRKFLPTDLLFFGAHCSKTYRYRYRSVIIWN